MEVEAEDKSRDETMPGTADKRAIMVIVLVLPTVEVVVQHQLSQLPIIRILDGEHFRVREQDLADPI